MSEHCHFRRVNVDDAPALVAIYNHYILHSTVTFEYDALTPAQMAQRIDAIKRSGYYLVAEDRTSAEIIGFAYAKPWHEREAYRYTYESTVYLAHQRDLRRYRGLGSALYQALIEQIVADGKVRVLLGIITADNHLSHHLHKKLGFEKIAEIPRLGYKFEQWLGIVYWAYYFSVPNNTNQA